MAGVNLRRALVNGIASRALVPTRYRWRAYRLLGIDTAPARIYPGAWFGSTRVTIGPGAFVNRDVMLDASDRITLGARVSVAFGVAFCTSTHELGDHSRRAGAGTSAPIVVGDGTWIGARATIMPGVTIGPGCVIAAGAMVTRDCDPGGLYAGVPARRVRDLDDSPADPTAVNRDAFALRLGLAQDGRLPTIAVAPLVPKSQPTEAP